MHACRFGQHHCIITPLHNGIHEDQDSVCVDTMTRKERPFQQGLVNCIHLPRPEGTWIIISLCVWHCSSMLWKQRSPGGGLGKARYTCAWDDRRNSKGPPGVAPTDARWKLSNMQGASWRAVTLPAPSETKS